MKTFITDLTFFCEKGRVKVAMDELMAVGSSKVKTFIIDLSRDHYANVLF